MSNTLNNIIVFAVGATIGSVITWKFVSTKYEKLIQEEIDSVKEVYSKSYGELSDSDVVEDDDELEETIDEEMEEYKNIASAYGSEYTDEDDDDGEENGNSMDEPYVISPEEFADSDYETASLWYFADGVLTDEQYNIIEDVDETVGKESLTHFGDYVDDPDTVYVRNDYLEVDYEICRDERKYSEIE